MVGGIALRAPVATLVELVSKDMFRAIASFLEQRHVFTGVGLCGEVACKSWTLFGVSSPFLPLLFGARLVHQPKCVDLMGNKRRRNPFSNLKYRLRQVERPQFRPRAACGGYI